jgi:hypothetical protein
VRYFERFWGFLKTFTVKWEVFIKFTRLLEDIFKEMEALIRNLRLLSKITRRFEDIFHGIKAFLNNSRLVKNISR